MLNKTKQAVGFEVLTAVIPCPLLLLISCMVYSSYLKREAIFYSESLDFARTKRFDIPKDQAGYTNTQQNPNRP
jgi:hypothetical protein